MITVVINHSYLPLGSVQGYACWIIGKCELDEIYPILVVSEKRRNEPHPVDQTVNDEGRVHLRLPVQVIHGPYEGVYVSQASLKLPDYARQLLSMPKANELLKLAQDQTQNYWPQPEDFSTKEDTKADCIYGNSDCGVCPQVAKQ